MKKSLIVTALSLFALLISGCNTKSPSKKKKSSSGSKITLTSEDSTGSTKTTTGETTVTGGTTSDTSSSSGGGTSSSTSSGTTSTTGTTTTTTTTTGGTSTSTTTTTTSGGGGGDSTDYYPASLESLTGSELRSALNSLNNKKRESTVGYDPMGTTTSSPFKYTDYDPSSVKYDENGQPYGTVFVSFYSGNTMTSFNKEHVWPKSHGGNLVEADIHHTRPTINAENSARGNAFYVEGMKDGTKGWDPAMESFGDETYRGEAARIIFYSAIASLTLNLTELTYHATTNNNRDNLMGQMSCMLDWSLRYPVTDRERRRNEGAEYLQGNRNPFIDHPEYACRIWGGENDATKKVCGIK